MFRDEGELRLALYRATQKIRELYEELERFSATKEALLEELRTTEASEEAEGMLEILSDGIADAQSELTALGEEFLGLSEELEDSLWYLAREGVDE